MNLEITDPVIQKYLIEQAEAQNVTPSALVERLLSTCKSLRLVESLNTIEDDEQWGNAPIL